MGGPSTVTEPVWTSASSAARNQAGGSARNAGSVQDAEVIADSEPDATPDGVARYRPRRRQGRTKQGAAKGEPMTGSQQGGTDAGPRAPELAVTGIDQGPVRLGDLTARGCAFLVFVSEECPTSALALRNLGPLCRSWEQAGLTATAVFEDPLEVGLRAARRLGWTGRVVSQAPPYETSRAYGLLSVPTTVLVDRAGILAGTVVGWDQPALLALTGQASAMLGTATLAAPPAAEPRYKPGCSSKAAIDPEIAAAISS